MELFGLLSGIWNWVQRWHGNEQHSNMVYLYFWKNGNHRYDDAENKVEADEELVFGAVVGFGVVEIKQHDCCKGQSVMQDSEAQQTCGHRKQSRVSFSEKSGFGHTCLQTWWTVCISVYLLSTYLKTNTCCCLPRHSSPTPHSRSGQSRSGGWAGSGWTWRSPQYQSRTKLWLKEEEKLCFSYVLVKCAQHKIKNKPFYYLNKWSSTIFKSLMLTMAAFIWLRTVKTVILWNITI